MKFTIHFTVSDNEGEQHEDSVIIEGDTIQECRNQAASEVEKRGGFDAWSEEIEPCTS